MSQSGPAKLPPEIVDKTHAEVCRIVALPDVVEKLAAQGTVPRLTAAQPRRA